MKFFASKRIQRINNFVLAAMLVLSTLTASVPFIFSQKADAAPGVSYTTPSLSQGDWTVNRAAPSGGWTVDTSANQRVILNVNQAHASTVAQFYQTEGVSKALPAGTDSIKADVYVAADWNTKPSLRAGLWGVASNGTPTAPSYPIIEYANIGGYTGWRVWNANDGTWNNVTATTHVGGQNTVEIVSNFNTSNYDFYVNNSKVYSYSADGYTTFTRMIFNNYNAGTNDTAGNYTVVWKNISTGTLPKVVACSVTNNYETVNLNNWDLSQTRATGHNELVANGLHIWTQGATSTDKVAGYFATNFALQDAGVPAISYVSTNGGTPGLQMAVDFNNDGITDGILVGESAYYGNDWWLSNGSSQFAKDGAPLHTGGSGSANHGTLNAWLAAFPSARVKAVGYSLGSGVFGNDVISSMTFGCVNYTFNVDTEKPVINTVYGTPGSTLNNAGSINVVATDNGGLKKVSFTVNGTTKYAVLNVAGGTTTNATLTKTIASLGLADGTYTIKAAAEDLNGNFAVPKTLTITVDNVAPTITVKPGSNGSASSNIFSNVSFKLYDANKIDKLTLNGVEKNLTDNAYGDLNGVAPGAFGAVEGANTLVVYDVAGNATTYHFVLDTSAATPTLVSPADGATVNGASVTQSWTTTDTDIDHYVYESYSDAAMHHLRFTDTYTTTHKTATHIADGTVYYWRVAAVDKLGNVSAFSPLWKITIDNTAPTAIFTFPARGPSATSFEVTFSEAVNATDATNPANYFLTNWPGFGGSGPLTGHADVTYDAASKTATVHFTTPGWYVSGEQLWGVTNVRDLAGNAITSTTAFSTAQTAPTAPGTPTATTPTNSLTTNWTWTAATDLPTPAVDASGIKGYQYQFTNGSTVITNWTDVALTSVTTTAPAAGTYQLHVRALDNSGSPVGPESVGTVVIDTTGPAVHVNANAFTSNQPTITGTVDPDTDHVNVTVEDANGNQVEFGPATYVANGTTWSYAVQNPLANGTYTIFARAYDALGNYTDNSALVTVAVAPVTNQTTTTVTPSSTPTITSPAAAAVLGATTSNTDPAGDTAVKGATDDKAAAAAVNSDANKGTVFGLAWYWWILILAALASITWFIIAAIRRRNEEQA